MFSAMNMAQNTFHMTQYFFSKLSETDTDSLLRILIQDLALLYVRSFLKKILIEKAMANYVDGFLNWF